MHKKIKNLFKPDENIKAINKVQRVVLGDMFSFIFWGGAILASLAYILFSIAFPPTTKLSAAILAILIPLYLGTLFGISLHRAFPKYWRKFQNKNDADSMLEDDLLFLYLKNSRHNFSTDTIDQVGTIKHSSNIEKMRMLKKITNQIDDEVLSFKEAPISERSEASYLILISILLQLMQDKSKSEHQIALFGNQTAIINTIINDERFKGYHGISKTSLDLKFGAANKSFKQNM